MGDKVTVPRADIEAIIEDVCIGCYETAIKHLVAILAAPIANPDYVMVPREPTQEMIEAAMSAKVPSFDYGGAFKCWYAAMLSAAPISNPDYVMVPREPTSQMLDAARGMRSAGASDAQVYRLMLSAAPLHPRSAAAEPVAWQYRLIGPDGPTKWRECNDDVRAMIAASGHYDGVNKVPAELRPLYNALPTELQKRG